MLFFFKICLTQFYNKLAYLFLTFCANDIIEIQIFRRADILILCHLDICFRIFTFKRVFS